MAVIACGLFVLLQLMLIHARHIPDSDMTHAANVTAGHVAAAPGLAWIDALAHSGLDCPAPQWVSKQIDAGISLPGAMPVIMLLILAVAVGSVGIRRPIHLPVPRGPDQQAVLQRFTL